MSKTANDVLTEWVLRGYVTAEQATANQAKYLSYINQAKDSISSYCNLPDTLTALPDGLFYPWVEIGWSTANGTATITGSGAVKSVSEGDTTVTYDVGTTVIQNDVLVNYKDILNKFRRLF